MENIDPHFEITTDVESDYVLLSARGKYSLLKANNLFKLAIDSCLLHDKCKILIDVTNITGSIPFFDRFQFSEYLANYKIERALTKLHKIAVVGLEPIIDKDKFGETVAVNRGTNGRVFTDMSKALTWLNSEEWSISRDHLATSPSAFPH